MAFDRAIYTDVRADEAVDGHDGFNFQAVSAGTTGSDLAAIRGVLLHQVQPGWAVDHDELSHPPTCAYVMRDGRRYLSRGISTGTTHNGRPGNQLTEIAISSDAGDFVPYRPAQLFAAEEWTLAKAQGTSVEPWLTPLTIREDFEVDALGAMLLDDPWATTALASFLTMVEQAAATEPTRLILLHDDIDVVMRWIAVGTLFLDEDRAMALQFRALVADPWRQEADVVGVSPAFRGSTAFAGANVLDLAGRTQPKLEPSVSAQQQARWLVELGIEDTLAASGTARRWAPALGEARAAEAARVLLFPTSRSDGQSEWAAAIGLVGGLIANGEAEQLDLHSEEIVEAAASYRPRTAAEFQEHATAVRSAHDAGMGEFACALLTPGLEALAATPHLCEGWAAELGQLDLALQWTDRDEQSAASQSLATVIAGAPDRALPDLLSAARALGLQLPVADLDAAARRVANVWLAEPALGVGRWQRWAGGDRVVTLVAAMLVQRLLSGDRPTGIAFLQGTWDHLAELPPGVPVRDWVQAARIGRTPRERKQEVIARSEPLPPESWTLALSGTTLDRDAAIWGAWVAWHGLPPAMGDRIRERTLTILRADPDGDIEGLAGDWHLLLPTIHKVDYYGDTPPDPVLWDLAAEIGPLSKAMNAALMDLRLRSNRGIAACFPHISRLAPLVLMPMGRLLVEAKDRGAAEVLAERLGPWARAAIETGLLRWVGTEYRLNAVELSLRLLNSKNDIMRATAHSTLVWLHEAHPALVQEAKQAQLLRVALEAFAVDAGLARAKKGRGSGTRGERSIFDRRQDG
ncbi:hypothetical protein [Nocardioides sp. W7]|uniref:GAP1-N2 domain-containing protein n=1 Tax=Nocardioides sp. W7 TaxID=2931390 RepID=UPI001FD064A6|nr:hypothetical protein [Nocardioides sp. W7]